MVKDFSIKKENGKVLRGKIYAPEDLTKSYPAVIFSHGFNGTMDGLSHHGEGFAEAGMVCVLFDFCGGSMWTTSDGAMTEMTIPTEVEELKLVLKMTSELPYVDADRIMLQGESMGGMVSAIVASERAAEICALCLWYPAFCIPEDSKLRFDRGDDTVFGLAISPDYNKTSMDIDIRALMEAYDGPVQLIHGDEDAVVNIAYSEFAKETYANASLLIIPGAGHGFDGEDSKCARECSIAFLQAQVSMEK